MHVLSYYRKQYSTCRCVHTLRPHLAILITSLWEGEFPGMITFPVRLVWQSYSLLFFTFVPIVPPKFTNSLPSIKTIKEGETLTLDCAASGTPTPNITWVQVLNSGNIIISEGEGSATLNIPNIQRPSGSSGKYSYKCEAKNIPSVAAVTRETEVIVQCKY